MKLDPGIHIAMHSVLSLKPGVTPGPRVAQQGSPEAASVCRENLQGKDRQEKVAKPPGQSETETPARGQEKVYKDF